LQVKGLSSTEANLQVPELIRKLGFEEKADALSMSLSGGQKRKLSLGCAIIGGSKVLFLDECSSGLDPEARRIIWDLLLEIRNDRTIVLTTHFLEEADVLGDRIAIMAAGKVQYAPSALRFVLYFITNKNTFFLFQQMLWKSHVFEKLLW
jgi:ATP-binding cassette subfamily A (ABC1) protein 3